MNFEQLIKLAEQNDVQIDNHKGYKRTPPFYYDSLRHAIGFYFNTFNTLNTSYDFYSRGLSPKATQRYKRQFLDEENTALTIVSFERFFELFIKDLLFRTNHSLILIPGKPLKKMGPTIDLLDRIKLKSLNPKKFGKKLLTIPFRETIGRFYDLIALQKSHGSNPIVRKFSRIVKDYAFLDSGNYKVSLQLLNWYRDRILHNGSRLPSLWFLDYFVTQRLVPIIRQVTLADRSKLNDSLFYFVTVTNVDIIEKLSEIKYEYKDIKNLKKSRETLFNLLKIGHLKELGRANLNMNLFVRRNIQASYEYNYRDPKGRGRRFAKVEKLEHEHAKDVKPCPCCGEESLVIYVQPIPDIFNTGENKVSWIKCYTCDYHLRHNVGDPSLFDLYHTKIFPD